MKIEIGYFEMFDGNFPFGLRGIYLFLPNNFYFLIRMHRSVFRPKNFYYF